MSDWQIRIPYRDRGDLVLEVIRAARSTMDDTEQRVVEALATDALKRGVTTVGGLLDELDGLDRAQTRRRLDWARGKLGLPSTGEVERRRDDYRFEAAFQRLQPPDPPRWSELQGCPAKGCGARPTTPEGALRPVTVNQWWCPRHEHLARPGDLEEYEPPYVGVNRNGRPIRSVKEQARIEAWCRERLEAEEREERKREEFLRREAEVREQAKEHWREEGEISILGIRCRPDGRVIER